MTKKQKIILGTAIPSGIIAVASIAVVATLQVPSISAKLLFNECNNYYQPLREKLDAYVKDKAAIETIKKDLEAKEEKLQNEYNVATGEDKKAKEKELSEIKNQKSKNNEEWQNITKKVLTLGLNLERIFKPMETTWKNIEELEKKHMMTSKLWSASKKVLQKVKLEYEAWILQDFRNII